MEYIYVTFLQNKPELINEVTKLIPPFLSLCWFIFVAIVFGLFYKPLRYELIPKITNLKAMGVELSFVRDSIDAALRLAEKCPQWQVRISRADEERVLNRAKKHLDIFKGAQILWIDDHPDNNINEQKMLAELKVDVDCRLTTDEAINQLKGQNYDIVISDMSRGTNAMAGIEFLREFRKFNTFTPVIFYVGIFSEDRGIPPHAFGITNRPDELLHLLLDVLERKRI
jgi:CheY-like chemotaxis protein